MWFLSRFSHKTSLVCVGSLFALVLIFEIHPQGRSFLTISPHYSLYKKAIFSTFLNGVLVYILSVFLIRFPKNISYLCLE